MENLVSAIRWRTLFGMLIVASMVFAACSSPARVATVTGEPVPEALGSVLYETACASCHGKRAQGGAGPALAGHTEEQIVRQVRAPVGEMPMFSPRFVSSYGLDDLVEIIEGLEATEGGGHAHDANLLSKQEVSQIQHALILRSIEEGDESAASHAAEEVLDLLSGNHLVAMTKVLEDIQSNRFGPAEEALTNMAADAPLTTHLADEDLLLTLVLNSLRAEDVGSTTHWLGHIEDSDHDHIAEIFAALSADDIEAAIELVERALPEAEDHGADAHTDDADAHTDDAEMDPEMDMDGEGAHTDDADAHTDDADAHTEPEPSDHDDGDAAPHDH